MESLRLSALVGDLHDVRSLVQPAADATGRACLPSVEHQTSKSAEVNEVEPVCLLPVHACAGVAAARAGAYPWLTGTASWSYVGVTQYILGIRPELEGLRIDPCLPAGWEGYEVTRRFRGMALTIRVANSRRRGDGGCERDC